MSKSLGNLVMVDKLLKTCPPDALRLFLGSHHYREAWSYHEQDLKPFQELADSLSQAARVEGGKAAAFNPAGYASEFSEAMENDLGTPGAVHALQELGQGILGAARDGRDVKEAQAMLRKLSQVFGLTLGSDTPEDRVIKGWNAKRR